MTAANTQTRSATHHLIVSIIWRSVFAGAFVASGCLSILALLLGLPYRMAMWSILVLPIFALRRIRLNMITLAYTVLATMVVLSGLVNGSSPLQILLFSRILIFSFLIYVLVQATIAPSNVAHVYRWCIGIAMIQLPIMLAQRFSYDYLPLAIRSSVHRVDIGFGSFNLKGDAAMSFFVTMVVLLLLFHNRECHFAKQRWFVLPWLSMTVLTANSEVMKPILVLIWGYYLITHPTDKLIIYATLVLSLVLISLAVAGELDTIWDDLVAYLPNNISSSSNGETAFLEGKYGRGAAVSYYLRRGISFLGNGPASYYDPISRRHTLGNRGHIFTFYSETGLLGLISSAFILFSMAFLDTKRPWLMKFDQVRLLAFVSIMVLGYTTEIMNDISVFLAYTLVLKLHALMTQRAQRELYGLNTGPLRQQPRSMNSIQPDE